MTPPKVSVLILNWNGERFVEACVESVLASRYRDLEVIVMDNASTDRSLALLEQFTGVQIIRNRTNLGYAQANNRGVHACTGKYVVTLNNDLTVEPDWLDQPISMLEQFPRAALASLRQMDFHRRTHIDSLYLFPGRAAVLNRMGHGKPYRRSPLYSEPGMVIGSVGASAIYRRETFLQLGGFDERFFAFHEESDLSMRAFLRGQYCIYCPESVVYHMGTQSFGRVKPLFYFLRERNRLWYIYKNFPLSFVARNIPAFLGRELKTAVAVGVVGRHPVTYLRARIAGIAGLGYYTHAHSESTRLFRTQRPLFDELLERRKLPLSYVGH